MTADARTHAKGWYVDPDDAEQLRYWDGSRWTSDRRERPSWGGNAGALPPAPTDRGRDRRRIFLAVVVIGALLCAVIWFSIPKRPPRTISDDSFRAAAKRICDDTLPQLRAERRPERRMSDEEVADRIEEVAAKLDFMVDDLAAVPVQPADQVEVTGWLDAWQGYVRVGRNYAEAIRAGDADAAEQVRMQGDGDARAIGDFASGNRIDSCIPYQLG